MYRDEYSANRTDTARRLDVPRGIVASEWDNPSTRSYCPLDVYTSSRAWPDDDGLLGPLALSYFFELIRMYREEYAA